MAASVIAVASAVAGALLQAPAVAGLSMVRSQELPANTTGLKHGGKPDRYVFMAGLEGAGHHFFESVFEECVQHGLCGMRHTGFYLSLHKDRNHAFRIEREWTKDAPGDGRLYPLNTVLPTPKDGVKMLSYPDARHNPNLKTYAEVAKSVGDDLKVVVLLRNATELLHSDISRWGHDEDHLLLSGEKMLQQLMHFDKSKVMCMWFGSFGFTESANALSKFLGVDVPLARPAGFDLSQSMVSHFAFHRSSCHDGGCERGERLAQLQMRIVREVCDGRYER